MLDIVSLVLLKHQECKLPTDADGLFSAPPWFVGHHSVILWFKFNPETLVALLHREKEKETVYLNTLVISLYLDQVCPALM
jgi:hypothetical protein